MVPRRAWVREKRRPKSTQADQTAALIPMLNYLGCRPNNRPLQREKADRQESPDFEAIEIVTPKNTQQHHHNNHHHRPEQSQEDAYQSLTHHHHHTKQQQRRPTRHTRTPSQEQPNNNAFARAAKTRTPARPTSVQEVISRPYQASTSSSTSSSSRLNPYSSSGGVRPYAGGAHASVPRVSPHMSRAMAVNLNAITPLAM